MLQAIRERATGWIAYIIIILLIIPFALWGINSYFDDPPIADVAQVGNTAISARDFQQAYQQRLRGLQNMLGANFDPALFNETSLKQEVLQQLIEEKVLAQTARQQGLRIGDEQLGQAVRGYEAFQTDGTFDPELYKRALYVQGYTPVAFEEGLRSVLMANQLRSGVVASSVLTRTQIEQLLALMNQKRDIEYVQLALAPYRDKVELDEEAIKAYYTANQSRFTKPEQVKVSYLELNLNNMAQDATVSEEELRRAYEDEQEKLTQPEERYASHILVKLSPDASAEQSETAKNQAQAIYDAIKSGAKTFDAVMQEAQSADNKHMEAGDLGLITKGLFDSAFDDALYALPEAGAISEPVKTPFGYHIIRADKITPAHTRPFDEVREQLVKDVQLQRAETQFYSAAEKLANLSFEHPDGLEPAAEALGLQIQESDWFARSGASSGIATYPKVTEAAFGEEVLKNSYNSEPLEVEPNHVIVLRVREHQAAEPLSLEDARADITEALRTEKAKELLQADIDTLKQRAEQGETLAALADAFHGELKTLGAVTRNQADVEGVILEKAFSLSRPQEGKAVYGVSLLNDGAQAVVAVKGVVPGDTDLADAERTALVQRLQEQLGTAEFDALLASQRQQTEIVTHNDRL